MTIPAPVFRRVRSGYEPDAVDRQLHQLGNRLTAAEARASEAETLLGSREAALAAVTADLAAVRESRPDLVADDVVADARMEAAKLRLRAQTEAERVLQKAKAEAESILSRARHEAAVVDERARQEFFWRRRQLQSDADDLRAEQERINRQRAQIKEQLNSLSALALQQTTSAPAVELMLDEDLVEHSAS